MQQYLQSNVQLINMYSFHVGGSVPVLGTVSGLSKNQTTILRRSFAINCYPNETTLKELARQTGLHVRRVTSWFRNKRTNTKKAKFDERQSLCEYIC